jgi:DNA-directed RNA polymerase subunit RPC12/RpoP
MGRCLPVDQQRERPGSGRGLACPRCGSQRLAVVYTRAAADAKVVRRRRCLRCAHRITTWERATGGGGTP